jgi:cell division inhibitor SulA
MYRNNVGAKCVLRNYIVRQEPATNLTVAEAMLATSATTPLFTPISIGKDFSVFEYISGDLGFSNPVREVIAGAHDAFGDEATVACLVSIGCGHSGVTSVPSSSGAAARVNFLERVAMDGEKVAQEIATQMRQLILYHRFSVNYGLEAVQSRAWLEPDTIAAHTVVYLKDLELAKSVDSCVDAINTGHGSATLEQLSAWVKDLHLTSH